MLNPLKPVGKVLDNNEKQIKRLRKVLNQVNDYEQEVEHLDDAQILEMTREIREKVQKVLPKDRKIKVPKGLAWFETEEGKKVRREMSKMIPQAFALVREVYKREAQKRHRDVQILGGISLVEGKLAEMKTGEGKTQVCVLPLYLYALAERGTHLVTANEYLARRDGEFNGRMFHKLGLTTGIVTHIGAYKYVPLEDLGKFKDEATVELARNANPKQMDQMQGYFLVECSKKEAYACDVTYLTNSEIGFDYLRDNMVSDLQDKSQRELFYCVVDEADALLVDESRTPLIISQPTQKANDLYYKFAKLVTVLDPADYVVEEKENSAFLSEIGIEKMQRLLGVENIWEDYQSAHHLENALIAQFIYKRDDKYIVRNGEIILVDEFTGRLMPGRRISNGIHEAIEAKESLPIQKESQTLATITYQNFFRLYKILAGMTGTALTESEEFHKIYKLDVMVIPTYKPIVRKDHTDIIYKTEDAKFKAVLEDVRERHAAGQPILVGTGSVDASERLSSILAKEGIKHEVLNAKNHAREAEIVARAGQKGAVTISTNMAGRGTDIILGEQVSDLGGLHVIGTERHEARRIDNQLRGRSGRAGDPGSSRFYVSLSDRLMRVFGGPIVKRLLDRLNIDDDLPIESRLMGKQIESAQKRMEGSNFDTRKNVKKYDDVLNAQRDVVYENRNKILQYFADAKELLKDDQYKDADLESIKLRDFVLRRIVKETEVIVDEFIVSNKIPRVNTRKILEAVSEIVPERLFKKVLEKGLKTTEETFIELLQKNDKPEHYKEQLREIVEHAYEEQEEEIGFGLMREIEKQVSLDAYDYNWMSHLETMEDLNHSVNMRSYGQRDPLVEYKNEGFNIFVSMMMNIDSSIARRILKLSIAPGDLLYEQTPGESENNTAKIKGSGAPVDPKQFISTREVLTSSKESKQSKKKQRKEEQRRKQQEAVMSRMPKKFKNK